MTRGGAALVSAVGAAAGVGGASTHGYGAGWSVISDFKASTYYISEVSKTLGQVWTEDATNWGPFDTANVVAGVGLKDRNNDGTAGPIMTPAAVSGLDGGFSAVATIVYASPAHLQFDLFDNPDYAGWYEVSLSGSDTELRNGNDGGEGATLAAVSAGAHTLKMTVSPTKISLIIDGGSLNTATVTSATTNAIALAVSGEATARIELIKFRPAVDDATLATLT